MCVCLVHGRANMCVCVCTGERWFQSFDCDSFSWDHEKDMRQPLLKQQRGVAVHRCDNGPLWKTRRPSPPVFWREHMFACLYFCQQPPLQWQRPWRAVLLVCREEESFPVRPGWYDDSFHSNALVWFLCKHGYEKCFLGGRSLRWRQIHDISPSKERVKESKLVKVSVG